MRVIISSKCLYFFEDSPPDPTSLEALFGLDQLVECRATQAKTSKRYLYYRDRDSDTEKLCIFPYSYSYSVSCIICKSERRGWS